MITHRSVVGNPWAVTRSLLWSPRARRSLLRLRICGHERVDLRCGSSPAPLRPATQAGASVVQNPVYWFSVSGAPKGEVPGTGIASMAWIEKRDTILPKH